MRYTTRAALEKHIGSIHLGERAECSEFCDILARALLDNHARKQCNVGKANHKCMKYHDKFTSKLFLVLHILRVHKKVRQTCPTTDPETKDLLGH